MWKADTTRVITPELIQEYIAYLREQEKSEATIQQYNNTALLSILRLHILERWN